jgi:hypothetical protein
MTDFWQAGDFGENFKILIDKLEMLRGDDLITVMIKRR